VSPSPTAGEVKTSPAAELNPSPGNTPGNIANIGFAATDGEWDYCWAGTTWYDFDGGKLCKMKPDGSSFQVLSEDIPCFINVVGDWLYYIKQNRAGEYYGEIIRLSKDGANRKELYAADCTNMTVVGEWIYFINVPEGNKIYKMKTDGSELAKLNDNESYDLQYEDGWLYYSGKVGEDKFPLYKMNILENTQPIEVLSDVKYFLINRGWIFYYNFGEGMFKMKDDGTGKVSVYNQPTDTANITDDSIFCISTEEVFVSGLGTYTKVYNLSLDGKKVKELPNKDGVPRSTFACIVGEYIYYFKDCAEWYEVGRMKNDGSFDEVMIDRLR
ncbi:MAG: DUF5050 domain-containing protein, partial [Bacillota bacterium]